MTDLLSLSTAVTGLGVAVAPRIVAVEGADGRQASGFIWRTGLAVAAHEALDGEDEAEVLRDDGSVVKAQIAGRDPATDVVLLKFDTGAFDAWTESAVPLPGALVVLAGRSERSAIVSLASVTEVGPAWRSMRGGEIDRRILVNLGLSTRAEGAAVIAPDGALVGMAVTGAGGRTLVIPASTIARSVTTLADKGYVPRGWLGVVLHPLGEGDGAVIVGLEKESPAGAAGLLVGDVVTTWGGEPVKSVGDLVDRLGPASVGQKITLGVQRGGNPVSVDVTLAERPRR